MSQNLDTAPYVDASALGSSFFRAAMTALNDLRARVVDYPRLSKDEHAIVVATVHAFRVDCVHRLTGAVGVDAHGRFIGAGRNGTPPGRPGCRDTGTCEPEVHAAENLSYYTSATQRRGSAASLSDAPCPSCVRVLACAEWGRVIYPVRGTVHGQLRWDVLDTTNGVSAGSRFFQAVITTLRDLREHVANHTRISRDEHALLVAAAHALRADCTRRRVGAVGVDVHGRFIGAGRNGAPPRQPGCLSDGACPRGRLTYEQVAPGSTYAAGQAGACTAGHAEENLSYYTDPEQRRGATAAITDAPCDNCAKVLAATGWARAVWPRIDDDGQWHVVVRNIALAPIGGLYAQSGGQ